MRRGASLLVHSLGDGPDFPNSKLERCAADGTACVTLNEEPNIYGVAANETTAWTITYGNSTNQYKGIVKRRRF
jgi:hypothetical protein